MGGRARTGGRRLEWRGEVWDLGGQLRLVIQAVVGICRMRLVRGRRHAWVAGRAWQGGCLGTDDRRRTVDLAEVSERDLRMEWSVSSCVSQSACAWSWFRRAGTYREVHGGLLSNLYGLMMLAVCEGGSGFRGSADCREPLRAQRGVVAAGRSRGVVRMEL